MTMRGREATVLGLLLLAGCQTAPMPDPGSIVSLETNYRLVVNCFLAARPTALVDRNILKTGYAETTVVLDPDTPSAYRVVLTEVPVYRITVSGQAIGAAASPGRWGAEVLPAINACNESARRGDL